MGNDTTLALIAKAAKKLERLDPDFAARMRANERKRKLKVRRTRMAKVKRAQTIASLKANAELCFDLPQFDVASVDTQDALLCDLAGGISAPPMKKRAAPRPKREAAIEDAFSPSGKRTKYTFQGQTKTVTGWAKATGICFDTLLGRLDAGWSIEKALCVPVGAIAGSEALVRGGYKRTFETLAGTSGGRSRDIEAKQAFFQAETESQDA